jgi:hypothetical protein
MLFLDNKNWYDLKINAFWLAFYNYKKNLFLIKLFKFIFHMNCCLNSHWEIVFFLVTNVFRSRPKHTKKKWRFYNIKFIKWINKPVFLFWFFPCCCFGFISKAATTKNRQFMYDLSMLCLGLGLGWDFYWFKQTLCRAWHNNLRMWWFLNKFCFSTRKYNYLCCWTSKKSTFKPIKISTGGVYIFLKIRI